MTSRTLAGKRIVVTGGAGFLGTAVVEELRRRGCNDIVIPRKASFDLTLESDIDRLMRGARPQVLIHLAAVVGGIGANRENPGRFFYENAIMGIQLIEYARRFDVEKTVVAGTVCAYPKHTQVPFREDDLWLGYPEETNAPYGIAKKALLVQCQAYREQYGMNAIYLLPVNLYGPGDNFDQASSHVIPGLIRRAMEARDKNSPTLDVWGDGTATREFLFVRDAAEAIVLAAERYDSPEPVNIGSGSEVSIFDLATTIADAVGYRGEIRWDTSKPNGQPRRMLDTARARSFGFAAKTSFEAGLRETVAWYEFQRRRSAAAPIPAVDTQKTAV